MELSITDLLVKLQTIAQISWRHQLFLDSLAKCSFGRQDLSLASEVKNLALTSPLHQAHVGRVVESTKKNNFGGDSDGML